MRSHYKSMHSEEAGIRRKRQETHVAKALDNAGFIRIIEAGNDTLPPNGYYRREFHVDYRCVDPESSNKFHRIDFIVGVPGGIVVLEVDEHQHLYGYDAPVSCDMRRMNRIMASWRIGNTSMPNILWIRYNPHKFEIDGVPQNRVMKEDREAWLIRRLKNGVHTPLAIEYAYYDVDIMEVPLAIQRPGYHPMYFSVASKGKIKERV